MSFVRDSSLKSHRVFFRNWPICGFNFNLIKNNMTLTFTTTKEPGKHNQLQINRIKLFWLRCVTFIAVAIRFTALLLNSLWVLLCGRHSKFKTLNKSVARKLYSKKTKIKHLLPNPVSHSFQLSIFFLYFDSDSHSD